MVSGDVSGATQQVSGDLTALIGIPLALVGAVILAVGALLQHRAVVAVAASSPSPDGEGMSVRQLLRLLGRPSWAVGLLLLGLAVVFQFASLLFAPIIVVQPLGVVALVVTALINTRHAGVRLNRQTVIAIGMCVGGVFLFVATAAFTAVDRPVTPAHLTEILLILTLLLTILVIVFSIRRHRLKALFYVLSAGALYGFVAVLAKAVLGRLRQGEADWLTAGGVLGLVVAALLGAYFLQNAYATGPADLVVAGMTVIDPLVAVAIGIIVLGEAAHAPGWAIAVYALTAAIAIRGVFRLARHHPHTPSAAQPAREPQPTP